MLLVSFRDDHEVHIGLLNRRRGEVIDLAHAAPGLPREMTAFIALGEKGLKDARRAEESGEGRVPLARVQLLAPLPNPARNIFCIGKNYRDHAQEVRSLRAGGADDAIPKMPIVFTKATTTVIGPQAPIPVNLDPTGSTDYEGELGVIIGRGGRGIPRSEAMAHVYGYTVINDVTSRRLQFDHQQWFIGKSLDGYCPMGPAIATADEIHDLGSLRVRTVVNGELRQDSPVSELIFDVPALIEALSRGMTLAPGDIIATGTPAGVGMGFDPPKYLQSGDRVAVTIEPIGTLENPVQ